MISFHSSSMASIQLSTPSSLLSPFVIEKHHFVIFNLNSSVMKSCSKINNTPLHLKLAPLLSMLTAPDLHTPTIPTSRKPRFFAKPPSQYRHPSPHNQFHNPPFSPRHSPNFSPRYQPPSPPPLPTAEPSNPETPPPPRQYFPCQICGKTSHRALDCFHRMDFAYRGCHPPMQLAAMTAQANEELTSQDLLADSGANTHVIAESSNLTNPQPFDRSNTVGVGNGAGLPIQNIGSSLVHSPTSSLHNFPLKNILHCPSASANLLSINKFCKDNKCWFALTDVDFTVKDNLTRTMLLHDPTENGLYPIKLNPSSLNKRSGFIALLGVKTNDMVWHQRLGHSSTSVFQHLLRHHNLHLLGPVSPPSVCESCQLEKSKQLPFFTATRGSTTPL
jgi:hypothetical protein